MHKAGTIVHSMSPFVPRGLRTPHGGSPTLTAFHGSRVIKLYLDEFDEIIAAGDVAIIVSRAVWETILVHEANPRLGEMDKSDDRVAIKEVLKKENTTVEINPAQRVSSDSDLLGQAMATTQ